MPAPTDPGDFTPGTTIASAAVNTRFQRLYAALAAGAVDETLLASGLLDKVGVSSGATVRRGQASIAAAESRTNTAYGLLTTPDRVSSIVLPTGGVLRVRYQAIWQEQVAGAARAAIFVGGNQMTIAAFAASPLKQAACTAFGQVAARDCALHSAAGLGLVSPAATNSGLAELTTGQAIGGAHLTTGTVYSQMELESAGVVKIAPSSPGGSEFTPMQGGVVEIFAAAGTYDVSVQFKASSGTVAVKNRHLWVEAIGF